MRVRALRQGETLQVNASVLSSLVECEKGSKGDGGNAVPARPYVEGGRRLRERKILLTRIMHETP